jgi:uncharacterized protein YcfJ
MLKTLTVSAAALVLTGALAASPADARMFRHERTCHEAGTVTGAVVGGVVGNAVTGHSAIGTVAGAGVGAVAGHSIAQSSCHHDTRYYYRNHRRGYYSYDHGRRYWHYG